MHYFSLNEKTYISIYYLFLFWILSLFHILFRLYLLFLYSRTLVCFINYFNFKEIKPMIKYTYTAVYSNLEMIKFKSSKQDAITYLFSDGYRIYIINIIFREKSNLFCRLIYARLGWSKCRFCVRKPMNVLFI